ncbi:MAG: hypothetical protein AB1489_31890 [Acidobacteriota bacterium]
MLIFTGLGLRTSNIIIVVVGERSDTHVVFAIAYEKGKLIGAVR